MSSPLIVPTRCIGAERAHCRLLATGIHDIRRCDFDPSDLDPRLQTCLSSASCPAVQVVPLCAARLNTCSSMQMCASSATLCFFTRNSQRLWVTGKKLLSYYPLSVGYTVCKYGCRCRRVNTMCSLIITPLFPLMEIPSFAIRASCICLYTPFYDVMGTFLWINFVLRRPTC